MRLILYSLKEIKGLTFPKFKKEYKKRLERLWVDKYVVSRVCGYKDLTTLSQRTWKNSGKDLDWFICHIVLHGMLKELKLNPPIGFSSWYGDKYRERLKEVEEYEKSLLESEVEITKMSIEELQRIEETTKKELDEYRWKCGSTFHWDETTERMEEKLEEVKTIIRFKEGDWEFKTPKN